MSPISLSQRVESILCDTSRVQVKGCDEERADSFVNNELVGRKEHVPAPLELETPGTDMN